MMFFLDRAWWAWNGWPAVAALAQTVTTVAAVYVAGWIAPRFAERAGKAAEDRQSSRDAAAELQRFRAAALLVHDELRANLSLLQIAEQTGELPEPLADRTYADYQLLLATHLDQDARDSVRAAYVYPRVPRVFVRKDVTVRPSNASAEPFLKWFRLRQKPSRPPEPGLRPKPYYTGIL